MYRLSINLIKSGFDDIKEFVQKEHQENLKPLTIDGCDSAYYIYKGPQVTRPGWYKFVSSVIGDLEDSLTSPSALIILKKGQ